MELQRKDSGSFIYAGHMGRFNDFEPHQNRMVRMDRHGLLHATLYSAFSIYLGTKNSSDLQIGWFMNLRYERTMNLFVCLALLVYLF